jgi:hypothetical protein
MSRRWVARVVVGSPVAGVLVVAGASAAYAHRPYVKANLIRLDGAPNGFIEMQPTHGGRITLDLPDPPASGRLTFDVRMKGATTSVSYALKGAHSSWPLGFVTHDQDKLELTDLRVLDGDGNVVAEMGTGAVPPRTASTNVFAVPLVWRASEQQEQSRGNRSVDQRRTVAGVLGQFRCSQRKVETVRTAGALHPVQRRRPHPC